MTGILASARATEGCWFDVAGARRWLTQRRLEQRCSVTQVPFAQLRGWRFEEHTHDLVHDSGKFFRVQGLRARSDFPTPIEFEQPVVNQPEVGIVGLLAKRFDGILHFLVHAKMQPGNVDLVQLSPTVQATRSNYTRVHGGAGQRYLEFFIGHQGNRVLIDQLQSEHGLFFLRKRNRNIIVETDAEVALTDDFRWLTLGQIKHLARDAHVVNLDTRTLLAALPLAAGAVDAKAAGWTLERDSGTFAEALVASTLATSGGSQSTAAVLRWLNDVRSGAEITCQPCPLRAVRAWERDDRELRRSDGGYFKVLALSVESDSREIASWTQPIVHPCERAIFAFVTRRIDGLLHFLVQARMEPGVWSVIELGPTVQFVPGAPTDLEEPLLLKDLLNGNAGVTRHRSMQCAEGGRFYRYVTEHIVTELDRRDDRPVPPNFAWMTLGQLNTLIHAGSCVNIEARSVLGCLEVSDASLEGSHR